MKKIVIIGANEFQNRLILKAKEMGYETHVFAWKSGDIGERTADFFYPISIVEKDLILEQCKKINPIAVTTIASDLAMITVNYVAEKLGLPCNKTENTLKCTNKFEMRKALKESGIPTPHFEKINDINSLKIKNYPLIVKPTDRSGSRAISLVNNDEELKIAISKAVENSFEKYAVVEEVIYGDEYSFESISYKGKHNFLTITKKFTTGFPKCIETGHIQPCGLSIDIQEKVKAMIFKALDVLGIENGASHAEFKVDKDGNIRIIEIGARMGGDCIGSDLVNISTGYDFMKMVIQVATGKEPEMIKYHENKIAAIKFIFSIEDLKKLQEIEKKYKNNVYYKSEILDMNHEIIDSSSRYGFYIFSFDSMDEYNKILGGMMN